MEDRKWVILLSTTGNVSESEVLRVMMFVINVKKMLYEVEMNVYVKSDISWIVLTTV